MRILLLFSFFMIIQSGGSYDPFRDYYMPVASAAYSDNPQKCLINIQNKQDLSFSSDPKHTISIYRQYKCGSLNFTCYGYTAVSGYADSDHGYIIIVFRGTTNYSQAVEEISNSKEMVPFIGGGKVSKLFFNAFNEIWINGGMRDDVYTLKNKHPQKNFDVMGHSVGGAMTSIAAATLVTTKIATAYNIWLTTFEQPRAGDKDNANAFNALYINAIRVVHNRDPVPHFPSLNNSTYYHHIQELWYPNNMGKNDTLIECNEKNGEDPNCCDSLSTSNLNLNDHKYYYGREFSDYGINGCPDLLTVSKFKNTVVKAAARLPQRLSFKTKHNKKL